MKTFKKKYKYYKNKINKKKIKKINKNNITIKKIFSKKIKNKKKGGTNKRKRSSKEEWKFKINKSLSILPSLHDDESQWEAYQSIFAYIMNGDIDSPYKLLLEQNDIDLVTVKPNTRPSRANHDRVNDLHQRIIYFKEPSTTSKDPSTHFIPYLNGEEKNPYSLYQAKYTQGFCQMFAYFIVMNDIKDFEDVDQSKKIDEANFNKLANNSKHCAEKSLKLLEDKPEIKERFKEYFDEIMRNHEKREYFGIKPETNCDQYLNEFKNINSNIYNVKEYIADQPLEGNWDESNNKFEQKTFFLKEE